MGRKHVQKNHRVEVYLRNPGDMGFMFISGQTRSDDLTRKELEGVARDIRRHVDNIDPQEVRVVFDSEVVCEFCDSRWTEDTEHNGGCCRQDAEIMERIDNDQGTANAGAEA